jgi:hypothetical protein
VSTHACLAEVFSRPVDALADISPRLACPSVAHRFEALVCTLLISKDTNGLNIGEVGGGGKECLAGQGCGGSLLGKSYGGSGATPYAHGAGGYFGLYGTGQFDGQGSGHQFYGTVRETPLPLIRKTEGEESRYGPAVRMHVMGGMGWGVLFVMHQLAPPPSKRGFNRG